MLPRGSVDGGPVKLSRRLFACCRAAVVAARLECISGDIYNKTTYYLWHTYLLLVLGKAAMDSLRLRPKIVFGTFEIVTTECRRPPRVGVGV